MFDLILLFTQIVQPIEKLNFKQLFNFWQSVARAWVSNTACSLAMCKQQKTLSGPALIYNI